MSVNVTHRRFRSRIPYLKSTEDLRHGCSAFILDNQHHFYPRFPSLEKDDWSNDESKKIKISAESIDMILNVEQYEMKMEAPPHYYHLVGRMINDDNKPIYFFINMNTSYPYDHVTDENPRGIILLCKNRNNFMQELFHIYCGGKRMTDMIEFIEKEEEEEEEKEVI